MCRNKIILNEKFSLFITGCVKHTHEDNKNDKIKVLKNTLIYFLSY